jgi:glycosyltransferase involved in cell wall biosynthesis
MTGPLVTVIIPSFNHARYIDTAVNSVVAQTYANWELIIIDDGSSDDTAEVLKKYGGVPRIQVVVNPVNRGQGFVVNQALGMSKGSLVCFLPSDDWYLPEKLAIQVERFLASGPEVGVVYGRGVRFFEDTNEYLTPKAELFRGWVLRQLIDRNFVYPITPMFRRECFERFPFDESYRAEGEAIYRKLAIHYQFDYVDEVVGVMRDHSSNTGKNVDLMYDDNLRYWREFFARTDLPEDIRRMRGPRIASLQRLKGLELVLLHRRGREGRALLMEAIRGRARLVFDVKVLGAIVMSFLPVPVLAKLYPGPR